VVSDHAEGTTGCGLVRQLDNSVGRTRSHDRTSYAAENVAEREGISRQEIVPVPLPNGELFTHDDGPRPGTTLEVLATLKPVFREEVPLLPATRAR
jgi:acetyl-CoA acetyltransferase